MQPTRPQHGVANSTMPDAAEVCQARQRIASAYDPELLRAAGHRLIDLLADHLARNQASADKVLSWCDPAENVRQAAALLGQSLASTAGRDALADRFAQLVETMLQRGCNLHDPRYIGHQVPAPVPLAGLFDAVGSVTNQAMAVYDIGPWATAVEAAMVQELGQQIGWQPSKFSGLATNGGSLANLTALLTARNVALGDCWQQGAGRSGPPPMLVVHSRRALLRFTRGRDPRPWYRPRRSRAPRRPASDGRESPRGHAARSAGEEPSDRRGGGLRLLDSDRRLRCARRSGRCVPALRRLAPHRRRATAEQRV